jgi:uncharacterized protein
MDNSTLRTDQVREAMDEVLWAQPDQEVRRAGFIHLYGVAEFCALLALKRGLNAEIGIVMGMLHDVWTYSTGDATDHAKQGAPIARGILSDLGGFTEDEIATICSAISHHSAKGKVHGDYDELLKDADVLQAYLYDACALPEVVNAKRRARLEAMFDELGIG